MRNEVFRWAFAWCLWGPWFARALRKAPLAFRDPVAPTVTAALPTPYPQLGRGPPNNTTLACPPARVIWPWLPAALRPWFSGSGTLPPPLPREPDWQS